MTIVAHIHDSDDRCVGVVCGDGFEELRRDADRVRWCFRCRAHLPHDAVLMGSRSPSYYDPYWRHDCSRCHQDRTTFPGSI